MKFLEYNVKHRFWRGIMTWGSKMLEARAVGGEGGKGNRYYFLFPHSFPHGQDPSWRCTCTVTLATKMNINSMFLN